MNREVTAKELASLLNVGYAAATGLITYLVAQNLAKMVGKRTNGAKGKAPNVYAIPESLTINLNPVEEKRESA